MAGGCAAVVVAWLQRHHGESARSPCPGRRDRKGLSMWLTLAPMESLTHDPAC
jgi:hypothetical protein